MKNNNLIWHHASVTRARREAQNKHKSVVLWFTGLSGSGKSTLAHSVEEILHQRNCRTFVLDGDNVRHGLCADLGFLDEDRQENIRRVGETAKLFVEAGVITLTAFISPFRADRKHVRSMFTHGNFLEIFCDCSLEICEQRDIKGLYKRARTGEVKNFTGINSPYELPEKPELKVETGKTTVTEATRQVMDLLESRGILIDSYRNKVSCR